jgi:acylphosphatase
VAVVRRRLLVSGYVQGVFFRDSARRQARILGVGGHARNLHDGRVELVVEGEQAAVEQMTAWARRGPSHAEVTSVDVEIQEPTGEREFVIR